MSVISPHVYENETYEDYLDGQLSDEDIHYLEVRLTGSRDCITRDSAYLLFSGRIE